MPAPFLFVVCQAGVEWALKEEMARLWPAFRFAFSRPGLVTFKLPAEFPAHPQFELRSIFARTYGFSLGKVAGERVPTMAAELWALCDRQPFDHLHVWSRDTKIPGDRGLEPGPGPTDLDVGQIILESCPDGGPSRPPLNQMAWPGEQVLDCIRVEADQWWIGHHRVAAPPSRWPGGVLPVTPPEECVSRAYRKMAEALAWSRFPVEPGEAFVEIGSAPGGASQALLERGLRVTGVDPANMAPQIMDDPRFTHVRKRGADLRRVEYRSFRWLAADVNVAPTYTLDTVQDIVTHPRVNIRGLLLTLKLLDRPLYAEIPTFLERIRSWGYQYVRARQLAYNRQEICVAALRQKSLRRGRRKT